MVGMTLQGMAQDKQIPLIKKFIKVNASGVNLRKEPNTSSPRLIFQDNVSDDCMDCDASLEWSSKPLKNRDKPARASVLAVIGESGDWYHVYFYENLYDDEWYSEKAYIMKKFCTDAVIRPLSLSEVNDSDIVVIKSGRHKNVCIRRLFGYMDRPLLWIGQYKEGKFVFTYSVEYEKNDNSNATVFDKNWEDQNIVRLGKNLFDEDVWQPNLKKLAADTDALNALINNPSKLNKCIHIYYGIEGDSDWHEIGECYMP